jgi:ketosteroid isomerase-like protein
MTNVEIIRERLERWIEHRHLVPEHFADDFVWDMSTADWPGQDEFHGPEGMQEFLREWLQAWDDWTYEIEDVVETPDGRAAVIAVQRGLNRAAGVPVEMRMVQVWSIDERGRATRMQMYTDAEAGLAAVGVTPET